MGRHAGWIAAAGGLAADEEFDLPLVTFSRDRFDRQRFLARVEALVKKHGYCSVVVSEGVRDGDGKFLSDQGVRDAFGHAQLGGVAPVIAGLVKEGLGFKYHWAVADYLQRSARHIASKTDVEQAYAVGRAAVRSPCRPQCRDAGDRAQQRQTLSRKIGMAPLAKVANVEKKMPRHYISRDGFGITAACRDYLLPLIKGEDYLPYRNGLPRYVRLKNVAVKKKTGTAFTSHDHRARPAPAPAAADTPDRPSRSANPAPFQLRVSSPP